MGYAHLPTVAEAEQTMGMPITDQRAWTVADVWALPADPHRRYEVVDGTLLVTPAPSLVHQRAVRALLRVMHDYARAVDVGEAIPAPFDIVLDDRTLVQPDVCVIPTASGPESLPLLAIEVLSPATARYDRLVKRARYQRSGVEYWIVDLDSRLVERWTPDADRPEICPQTVRWQATGAPRPCELDVEALIREAHGEA
jgi:Uma2 family endonuclease